jgi:hypothetical protein
MPSIEVDDESWRAISFAARVAGITEREVVRRMIAANAADVTRDPPDGTVPIYADYEGRRTHATYQSPGRVQISDGPLKGMSFKSPTGAARAIIRQYNPGVNDSRNGWTFFYIDNGDDSRISLQSIRPGNAE